MNYCRSIKCTNCCQWGKDKDARVKLQLNEKNNYVRNQADPSTLAIMPNGDCIYLDREKGCTMHKQRPINCRKFDCRKLLVEVMSKGDNIFLKTLMSAIKLGLMEKKR